MLKVSQKGTVNSGNAIKLLGYREDKYSQNGEDGIIEQIFEVIGVTNKLCCEFGAWDGVHLSNTHNLIKNHGWGGVQIEADSEKYKELQKTYKKNNKVYCLNSMVDTKNNSLEKLFRNSNLPVEFDFLSIDIDGLDYFIFKTLKLRPRLICVEVGVGHSPRSNKKVPFGVARNNTGQPLPVFCKTAAEIGYRLVCYDYNAFFLRNDVGHEEQLPTLDPEYAYSLFINSLSHQERKDLYSVNRAWVPPYYHFNNPYLTAVKLKLSPKDILKSYLTFRELQAHRRRIGEI